MDDAEKKEILTLIANDPVAAVERMAGLSRQCETIVAGYLQQIQADYEKATDPGTSSVDQAAALREAEVKLSELLNRLMNLIAFL